MQTKLQRNTTTTTLAEKSDKEIGSIKSDAYSFAVNFVLNLD